MYNNLVTKQMWALETDLLPAMAKAVTHPAFGKGVGYVADCLGRWRIQGGYWLAPNKNDGNKTDLISENALKSNPKLWMSKPYYVKGKDYPCTWEHVCGVRDVAKQVFTTFQKLNCDEHKTLQWINDSWEDLMMSIQTTKEENHKLSKLSKQMTFEQKLNMEHYKALGIKLYKVEKRSHLYKDYNESVKSLIKGNV